jgi:DNA-binding CsgD family transcriptional regulator
VLLFAVAAIQLYRTGMAGNGRITLVSIPLYALLLAGFRSGWLALILGTLLYIAFVAVLAAGAGGYVTKREVGQYLVEAVHEVLAGKLYVSPRFAAGLVKRMANRGADDLASLSEQQRHVYRLLGEGASAAEIAVELQLSPRTVESYCARMIEKFGLSGMKELRRQAIADRLSGPS